MLAGDLKRMLKKLTDDDVVGGVFLAVPTGEVLEENPNYIEVLIYNQSYYARPSMPFGVYNIPDKEWLKKYKDEILLVVAFENGNPAHPVVIGAVPTNKKYPAKAPIFGYNFKTAKYNLVIDDNEESLNLSTYKGQVINHDSKGIKILSGKKSAVLGEELSDVLSDLITTLSTLTTVDGNSLNPATISNLEKIKSQIVNIKSKRVKIE